MINKTLFLRESKAGLRLLLIFFAVLTMYATMIIAMFDPKLGDSLAQMAQSMPTLFAAFGMLNVGATLGEFMGNYLYGFLLTVMPLIFIAMLANRLVVRYVESGSMAYLLATPNRRGRLVRTQALVLLAGTLVLLLLNLLVCIATAQAMFPGQLDIPAFLRLNVGLYGLHVFLSGLCFFAACLFNDSRTSLGVGAGLGVLFLLVQMLSQVGDKFEVLKYVTPYTLFAPIGLLEGQGSAIAGVLCLYAVGAALYAAAVAVFCKRDLPV